MIVFVALLAWVYLIFLHGRFWESEVELKPAVPLTAPDVDIIVPARDEAALIGPTIASLLAQIYAGKVTVILVDDNSTDGTADAAGSHAHLKTISGAAKPDAWSGKLWAMAQGVEASTAPLLLFTDADIIHDPRHLATLVSRLNTPRVDMVSEMVRLHCVSWPERLLIPAFVYFFQLLYPFAWVNLPRRRTAGAAGGTILLRREALRRIGGLESIKGELIDDVALARAVKKGGAIYLGHSALAQSVRLYPRAADVWAMISRNAYTQLNHSPLILAGTILGLALVWLAAPCAILFGGLFSWRFFIGLAAYGFGVLSFFPTLQRYRQPKYLALALPAIAAFYMAATIASAVHFWRGTGAKWKNRAYGGAT